jgi:hypothetical protein
VLSLSDVKNGRRKKGRQHVQIAAKASYFGLWLARWWPWWTSSLIDVGIVVLAAIVFVACEPATRASDQIATLVGIGAIVAAGLAPVVMKGKASSSPMRMQTGNTMTMTTP